MLDKTRIKNLAKKLREVAKELDGMVKDAPDMFSPTSRDSIVVRRRGDVQLYVQAQDIIRKWATRWEREFRTAPYIEKSYVHMTVSVLKRLSTTQVMKAVENYFDNGDRWTEEQRFPYPLFIKTINKHLPEGGSGDGMGQKVGGNMPGSGQANFQDQRESY